MQKQWLKPDIYRLFLNWLAKWTRRVSDRMRYMMPPSELIDRICSTNILDSRSLLELDSTMELMNLPFVTLGESDFGGFNGYALEPGPSYMWPNHELESEELSRRILMAINTDVTIDFMKADPFRVNQHSPKKRERECGSGQDLVCPSNLDDLERPGSFLFLQIGALCAFDGDNWAKKRDEGARAILKGPWRPTGFGVVVRVDNHGKQLGVYIIYSFYEEDDFDDSMRYHIPVFDDDGKPLPGIGRLQDGGEFFTVVRIANSLRDLKERSRFTVDVQERKECQSSE